MATGIFQVPLIEGPVSKTIIESEKPMRALLTALEVARADSTHLRLSGASVLVMIQNPLLRGVLQSQHPELYPSPVAGPRERFNSTLIAQNLELIYVDKFAYAASLCVGETPVSVDKLKFDPQRYRNVKILNSQLAKIEDHKKLVKSINKLFAESTELKDNSF